MDLQFDWQPVVDRAPKGYIELNDGETAIHGPIMSVTVDDCDNIVVTTKWQAEVALGEIGIPILPWRCRPANEPIIFPNFVVPYVIEDTPRKGERVRFDRNILYFDQVDGLDPSKVEGLVLDPVEPAES